MKPTAESLESFAEETVPVIEQELGKLGFPFSYYPPDVRMRMAGACGIVSETFRQLLAQDEVEAKLWIQELPDTITRGSHVLMTVDHDGRTIVMDGSYSQFFSDFGPDWLDSAHGPMPRFPEQRVLVFEDGQQRDVVEWMMMIAELSRDRSGTTAEMEEFYGLLWDLSRYEPFDPALFLKRDALQIRRAIQADGQI